MSSEKERIWGTQKGSPEDLNGSSFFVGSLHQRMYITTTKVVEGWRIDVPGTDGGEMASILFLATTGSGRWSQIDVDLGVLTVTDLDPHAMDRLFLLSRSPDAFAESSGGLPQRTGVMTEIGHVSDHALDVDGARSFRGEKTGELGSGGATLAQGHRDLDLIDE